MKQCPHCQVLFEDTTDQCPEDNIALQQLTHSDPFLETCLADRYKIISIIGSGGMGTVYKAQHMVMDRPIAIKVLHAHLASRPKALRRFHEEAKTLAQLRHQNIITIYDFGISPTHQPFLVMDYINGLSLKKVVEKYGPVPLQQIKPILKQIVDGLAYAHSQNVVHRDLKPENIMLTSVDGMDEQYYKVTLVDFGLAAFTVEVTGTQVPAVRKSELLGSPFYMSPEQCLSKASIDARSDIYSLAVVLYEALCGRLPYENKSGIAMLENHIHKQPLPFHLSEPSLKVCTELSRVFNQALEKEPENRYRTIDEFATQLNEALERDAVKLRAVKHRTVVALERINNAGSWVNDESTGADNVAASFFETQFQTGRQFLSRLAEIEAGLFAKGRDGDSRKEIEKDPSVSEEKKQCLYCGNFMQAGINFCVNCQRRMPPRPSKLSDTYDALVPVPLELTNKDAEEIEQAKSNIRNLRSSNLSTRLAKIQRILLFSVTASLLFTCVILCRAFFDMNKSMRYLTGLVNYSTKLISSSFEPPHKRR